MNVRSIAGDWEKEYLEKGIPSSERNNPSGSVLFFLNYLEGIGFNRGNGIDIGCGTGRNSIALANAGYKTIAFDFAQSVIEKFSEHVSASDLDDRIHPLHHDISSAWPIDSGWTDIAVDTFCFKHQIPLEHRKNYIDEINRSMRVGGLYLLTLSDISDGYYKMFFRPEYGKNIIVDPENNIPSVLYKKEEIEKLFEGFELVFHEEKRKPSNMHGKTYDRVTHVFIMKKLP